MARFLDAPREAFVRLRDLERGTLKRDCDLPQGPLGEPGRSRGEADPQDGSARLPDAHREA